jgi:hypothetical protein
MKKGAVSGKAENVDLMGFGFALGFCTFRGKHVSLDVCHIIVPKSVSLVTLGHEFAHGLFSFWH